MDAFVAAVAAAIGLAFGSFINVVAYRVPLGRSVVSPASACPACDRPIRPRDNIPVVSWLLLRGRCRDCGVRISARYPIVEAATAVLFTATVLTIGVAPELPAYLWFAAAALTLTLTDIDVHRLPNHILYPSTAVGALLLLIAAIADGDLGSFARAVGGGALYFVLFLALALVARGGFGFGDVKLAFFLGLFLAYQSWDVLGAGIALGIAVGGLWAIGLLITRKADRKAKIPFGPAMILGAFIALAAGQELADWYLGS
jgi:leader peptidase (prepilin peptidase)/N-methyltransferase